MSAPLETGLIRRLTTEDVPHAAIARRLGISRTTVVKAVRSDAPPRYVRKPVQTSFAAFEPRVRALLIEPSRHAGDGDRGGRS